MENKTTNAIKFIAYSRKSIEGEDRQTLSLDDQKRELEALAQRENLQIVESYLGSEKGESQSAHKRGRSIFGHIMEQIEASKANALLVWHPNRIARNAFDGGLVITLMDEGKLLAVKTPHKTYYNQPDDKFFLQMEFGMAKKSSDDNSVVVKRGLRSKIEKGWLPARAPIGYLNTKNFEEKGKNTILKDDERFETVKSMWDMMGTGHYSVMQVLKRAQTEWNLKLKATKNNPFDKTLSRTSIYKMFTNPFYYGYFEYGTGPDGSKMLYKGSHEPMITEEAFWRVQMLLGKKGRPRAKHKSFPFTGLMRCGHCDAAITAEEKTKRYKNGTSQMYIYYRCTKRKDKNCPEKYIEASNLDAQIDFLMSRLTISEAFQKWALTYLHEVRHTEAYTRLDALESKKREHQKITAQLASLLLKYTSPENTGGVLIDDLSYQTLKNDLTTKRDKLSQDLLAKDVDMDKWVELSERTFNFARYARIWFKHGDSETRRTIFAALGSNLVVKDKKLAVNLHPVFQTLQNNLEQAEKELLLVRTHENGSAERQNDPVWVVCPALR